MMDFLTNLLVNLAVSLLLAVWAGLILASAILPLLEHAKAIP
jgi:hypothetical protein